MGNVQNIGLRPPQASGQTLPPVAASSGFSSVLTNLMSLLEGLFDGPGIGIDAKDFSKDLGLGPQVDLERIVEKAQAHVPAEAMRDFSAKVENVREGLREVVNDRLDDMPYEEAAVQIDEIRRLVQEVQTRGMVGDDSGNPGTVVDEIMQQVNDLQRQFAMNANAGDEHAAREPNTLIPISENAPEEGQKPLEFSRSCAQSDRTGAGRPYEGRSQRQGG
jgi:hypothetical protein